MVGVWGWVGGGRDLIWYGVMWDGFDLGCCREGWEGGRDRESHHCS